MFLVFSLVLQIWWIVVWHTGNKIWKSKKISQGDVRIFHFQMWKTFLKTYQNSIFLSRDSHRRISSKFIHPSFILQVRTYYDFEKILAVNLVEMSPNQKNRCFHCVFHFLSNKKSLTAQIFFIQIYVVILVVIDILCVF